MIESLRDMAVVVTGGASGIGLATAEVLLGHGARVLIADLRSGAVDRGLDALRTVSVADSSLAGLACDVRSGADCDALIAGAIAKFGQIDALVHCAGILRPANSRPRPLYELDEAEYEAVVDTNLKGTFLMNRAALRVMTAQRRGQIVNLSSTSGRKGRPLDSLYSASKAGVVALSESVAEEARPFGVRVQVILPDAVDTPLWQQNGAMQTSPPNSLPPRRVAELIAFCLALPPDTMCEGLVIAPFQTRARKRPPAKPDGAPQALEGSTP